MQPRGIEAPAAVEGLVNSAGLLELITDRRAVLSDRLAAADEMGLADLELYVSTIGEQLFLHSCLLEFFSPAVADRHKREADVAREVGELVARAHHHCGVSPPDLRAVRLLLRDALELIARAK